MTASDFTVLPLGQVLAANVQRLLSSKGMSVEELADKAECTVSFVQDILSGRSGGLSLSELEGIAEALGVEPSDLLKRDPQDA